MSPRNRHPEGPLTPAVGPPAITTDKRNGQRSLSRGAHYYDPAERSVVHPTTGALPLLGSTCGHLIITRPRPPPAPRTRVRLTIVERALRSSAVGAAQSSPSRRPADTARGSARSANRVHTSRRPARIGKYGRCSQPFSRSGGLRQSPRCGVHRCHNTHPGHRPADGLRGTRKADFRTRSGRRRPTLCCCPARHG